MKPVDQSIFVNDPRGIPGDCLRAAVASLYELPLDAVPHFALYDRWMDALNAWLKPRVAFARIVHNDRGFEGTRWPDHPLLAFGMSPRGVEHAVVWLDGAVAHDPHPSRGGFVGAPYELWDVLPAPQPADDNPAQTHHQEAEHG